MTMMTFLFMTMTPWQSHGEGEENGVFDKKHAPLAEMAAISSGSDIGGGNLDFGHVATWCDDIVVALEDSLEAARMTLYDSSDYYRANGILLQAFDAALNNPTLPLEATSFTLQAIRRGRDLLNMMGAKDPNLSASTHEVLFNFFCQVHQFRQ